MVDQVVHDEAAEHRDFRQRHQDRAVVQQRPRLQQVGVARAGYRGPRLGGVPVEGRDQLRGVGGCRRRVHRLAAGRHVQLVPVDGERRPGGEVRKVAGQPDHRARFRMRPPVELVRRHALQRLAGARDLLVELRQQTFTDGHVVLPCRAAFVAARAGRFAQKAEPAVVAAIVAQGRQTRRPVAVLDIDGDVAATVAQGQQTRRPVVVLDLDGDVAATVARSADPAACRPVPWRR